jgi:hypothetical protein
LQLHTNGDLAVKDAEKNEKDKKDRVEAHLAVAPVALQSMQMHPMVVF